MSEWLEEVERFAEERHEGQFRKDNVTPYVTHPKAVRTIVLREFRVADEQVLAAALLHDTIEDTRTDFDDIAKRFGARVAKWVALLTKDKRLPDGPRERTYFAALAKAPLQVKYCKIADSLHNLRDSTPALRPKAALKARKLLSIFKGVRALETPLALLRAELGKR